MTLPLVRTLTFFAGAAGASSSALRLREDLVVLVVGASLLDAAVFFGSLPSATRFAWRAAFDADTMVNGVSSSCWAWRNAE